MGILSQMAVSSLDSEDATEVLQAFMETQPEMVLSVHPAAAVQKQPQGTGAGDRLIKPQ